MRESQGLLTRALFLSHPDPREGQALSASPAGEFTTAATTSDLTSYITLAPNQYSTHRIQTPPTPPILLPPHLPNARISGPCTMSNNNQLYDPPAGEQAGGSRTHELQRVSLPIL